MAGKRRSDRAFTMMEVMTASAVMAVAVAAITHSVSTGQVQTSVALHEMRANAIAVALMEEILSRPYDDPDGESALGPDDGEFERASFDNIDDYHGYTEAVGAVKDLADDDYPGLYARFGRSVAVTATTAELPTLGGTLDGFNVTVTVIDDKNHTWTLTRFITQPAP